jgi:hypothetical protein
MTASKEVVMSFLPIIVTATVTLLSGGAAIGLAARRRNGPVAEALARIALLGATTLFALLGGPS